MSLRHWFLILLLAGILLMQPRLLTALHINLAFRAQAEAYLGSRLSLVDRLAQLQMAKHWWNQEVERGLMEQRWWIYVERVEAVLAQMSPDDVIARTAYQKGRQQEGIGNLGQAAAYYRQAAQTDARFVPAHLALWKLLNRQGDLAALLVEYDLEHLAPTYAVSVPLTTGPMLLGYDLDNAAFAFDAPMPIVLYWQVREGQSVNWADAADYKMNQGGWETYRVGSRIYQVGEVTNLVWNAGFEQPSLWQPGVPPGYGEGHTYKAASAYGLSTLDRDGASTQTGCVYNTEERRYSGLTSPMVPVAPGRLYLAGGWVQEINATGGRILVRAYADPFYHGHANDLILLKQFSRGDWVYLGGMVSFSEPGAHYATLWADNVESGGAVCFDDLLFAALPASPVEEGK